MVKKPVNVGYGAGLSSRFGGAGYGYDAGIFRRFGGNASFFAGGAEDFFVTTFVVLFLCFKIDGFEEAKKKI